MNYPSRDGPDILGRRVVSDIVTSYNYRENSRFNYVQNQRVSASFKYAEGKVSSVLLAFDPLAPKRTSRDTSPCETDGGKTLLKSSDSSTLGSSTQTLVPDTLLLSPDQGIASPGNDSAALSASPVSDRRDRDSGMPPTPQDSVLDTLSTEVSEGLKLTEQQNVNIDANRLSGILNFLDPLLPEGAAESLGRSRSSTEGSGIAMLRNNPLTRLLFNEQGARPKSSSVIGSKTSGGDGDKLRRDKGISAPPETARNGGVFDVDVLGDQLLVDTATPEDEAKRHSDSSSEFLTKSRSSTESSCSSLVDASGGKTVGFETPSKDDKVSKNHFSCASLSDISLKKLYIDIYGSPLLCSIG